MGKMRIIIAFLLLNAAALSHGQKVVPTLAKIPFKLPDWGFAGYNAGLSSPAAPSNFFDVTTYGAKNDSSEDAAGAIQRAIDDAAAANGGTVFLPAGTYRLEMPINITTSRVVLKGAGMTKTTVYIPHSLNDAFPWNPLLDPSKSSYYSWNNAFIKITGKSQTSTFRTKVATIVAKAERKERSVTIDTNSTTIMPGDWIWLFQSDPLPPSNLTGSLVNTMYGGPKYLPSCGANCSSWLYGKRDLVRWASRVAAVNGSTVTFERELPIAVKPEWSPELHVFPETRVPRDCGVEDLRILFEFEAAAPHHEERGFNGIELDAVFNGWVRNVRIVNADTGVFVRESHFVSVTGVDMTTSADRGVSHIGIAVVLSADVRVHKFNIKQKMQHATSVSGAFMTVFEDGRGTDMRLDAHRRVPYGILYSNIDVGVGTNAFVFGGVEGRGWPTGSFTIYWNVRNKNRTPLTIRALTYEGKCSYAVGRIAYIGNFQPIKRCPGHFIEYFNGTRPSSNLFGYQLFMRVLAPLNTTVPVNSTQSSSS